MQRHHRILYPILDLCLALAYVYIFFILIPSRSAAFSVAAGAFVVLTLASGAGIALGGKWGRRITVVSACGRILGCLSFIGLLLASAAYLHGIYGAVGTLGAALSMVVAALSIQFVGLVPFFELLLMRKTRA
jgi:hypothetical protein